MWSEHRFHADAVLRRTLAFRGIVHLLRKVCRLMLMIVAEVTPANNAGESVRGRKIASL